MAANDSAVGCQKPAFIVLLLWVVVIIVIAYVLFWIVGKMGLPEPAGMIARIIVGLVALLLLLGLFFPGMGLRLPGL